MEPIDGRFSVIMNHTAESQWTVDLKIFTTVSPIIIIIIILLVSLCRNRLNPSVRAGIAAGKYLEREQVLGYPDAPHEKRPQHFFIIAVPSL
jgi:hypothetical protein